MRDRDEFILGLSNDMVFPFLGHNPVAANGHWASGAPIFALVDKDETAAIEVADTFFRQVVVVIGHRNCFDQERHPSWAGLFGLFEGHAEL